MTQRTTPRNGSRSRHRRRRPKSWRGWAFAAALLAAFAAYAVVNLATAPPEPPSPPPGAQVDPEVQAHVEKARAAALSSRRDAGAWRTLGYAYAANGLPELAARCLEQSLELGQDAHAWHQLATVLATLGETDRAVEAFGKAAVMAPKHAPAHWRAGLLLLEAGRLEEATARFEAARVADGKDPAPILGLARVALQKGDAEAAGLLLAPLVGSGRASPYARFLLARARAMQGDEAAAESLQSGAVDPQWSDPWDADLVPHRVSRAGRIALSNAAAVAGDVARAIAILEPVHARDQGDAVVALNLTTHYVNARRLADAERTVRRLLEREPGNATAHVHLALTLNALGRHAEALESSRRAVELNPQLSIAHEQQANALGSLGRFQEAAAAFGQARRIQPANPLLALGEGKAHLMSGRTEEAAEALSDAIRMNPELEEAWRMRAMLEEQRRNPTAAREAAARAQALRSAQLARR